MDDPREQVVLCLGGGDGEGCYHPVDWHVGPGTPAPGCDCCSWRKDHLAALAQVNRKPARMPTPDGVPPEKWAMMNRRERRAWVRGKA